MKTKKITFRGWRGRENLPRMCADMTGPSLSRVREYLAVLRESGMIVGGCPWCFFQTPRGEKATCPVCDTVVHADGQRGFPLVIVDGEPSWPGKTSRAVGERMFARAVERMEKFAMTEMLEDAWLSLARPTKKVVN